MRTRLRPLRRLCGLCALLALSTLPPLAAATFYVSPGGDDSQTNPGTAETSPFATLQRAADAVSPGDTVLILAGVYVGAPGANVLNINVRGTPSAWITFRAYPGHQPVLRSTGWQAINLSRAAYVEIAGLTLEGPAYGLNLANAQADAALPSASPLYNGHGIQADGRSAATTATMPHHLRVRDTTIRAFGGAGLSFIQADYIELENNTVTDCAWWSRWANSGITLYQNRNYDSDSSTYRIRILRNRVANNKSLVPWVETPGKISDGNGIILDDSRNTQNLSTRGAYTGYTLVANNLAVNNGGSGIHSYLCDRVHILNNTAYLNSQVLNYGEIFAMASGDIVISGNIAVARPDRAVNKASATSTNLIYSNNVYFGGNQTDYLGANSIVADPLFVAPSTDLAAADFRLQSASPAVGRGWLTPIVSAQTVVANFTDGTGTASSDQYAGAAGIGWTGAWGFGPTGGFASVANTNPLASGGGTYLAYTSSSGGSGGDIALNRQWSTVTIPDTASYRVSFNVRLDNIGNWNASGDYFTVSASNVVAPFANSPSSASSFIIRAYGAATGNATAGKWAFYNGAKDSGPFDATKFQSSTMPVSAGTTYQFSIDVNPLNGTYTVTINDGTSSVSSAALGFRSSTFTGRNVLNFNSAKSATTDSFSYSIDSISISSNPYNNWASSSGLSGTNALPSADPDGDSVVNFLEYAFASSPTTPTTPAGPTISLVSSRLNLGFLRARADLTYVVEASSDLLAWSPVATNPGSVSLTTPVIFTDSLDLTNSANSRRFLRLRVSGP